MSRARDLPRHALLALFLLALAAPLVDRRLRPWIWEDVLVELRNPAPWPWPPAPGPDRSAAQRFESWFGDALGLRDQLIFANNWQAIFVYGRSPHPKYVVGRRGWVFFAGDGSQQVWRGRKPLAESRLEAWAEAIRARRERIAELGAQYVFCVAPNKETIYPELLPDGEEQLGTTPLEQLAALCAARGEPAFVDLRAALRAERAFDDEARDDHTYLRLGTHFSYRGGWAAVEALVAALAGRVGGLKPLPRELWHAAHVDDFNGDDPIGRSLHLDLELHEPQIEWVRNGGAHARVVSTTGETHPRQTELENPDAGLPRILFLHDSFGQWMRNPLAEHAGRLWTRWHYNLPLEEIADLHPDLVVQVVTERHLLEEPVPLETEAESLAAPEFEKLPPVLVGAAALAALAPYLDTRVERDADGLVMHWQAGFDKLLLPAGPLPAGARPALLVELELARRGNLTVWYQTSEDPQFRPRRRVIQALEAGRQRVRIALPVVNPPGQLLLSPGGPETDVRIRAWELRALGP